MLNKELYWVWQTLVIPNIRDEFWVASLKAIDSYKQRILSFLEKNDFAFMPNNTLWYNKTLSEIYRELKIPFIDLDNIIYIDCDDEINITSSILNEIKNLKLEPNISSIFPFINSRKIDEISNYLKLQVSRSSKSSEIINDKSIAQSELRKLWVNTPEWKVVYTDRQAIDFFNELINKWYKTVTFKLRRAASWMWVFKISNVYDLEKKLLEHWQDLETWILMDAWIEWDFISSPNVQFYVWKINKKMFIYELLHKYYQKMVQFIYEI